jgi:hypothetical protein
VNAFAFHPFDDHLVATAAQDAKGTLAPPPPASFFAGRFTLRSVVNVLCAQPTFGASPREASLPTSPPPCRLLPADIPRASCTFPHGITIASTCSFLPHRRDLLTQAD